MRFGVRNTLWSVLATGSALAAGVLTRKAMRAGWEKAGREPPADPGAARDGWKRALTWGVVSGVAVGLARVLGRKTAAEGWRRLTGERRA